MPTGYTCDIDKGQSFEDFALNCARAFGACAHQRDDTFARKPKLREKDTYHVEGLAKAVEKLNALNAMSADEKIAYGEKLKNDAIDRHQEYFNNKVMLRNKYDVMLVKVVSWNPPSPSHQELKNFMADQINKSIEFDCNTKYDMEELTRLASTPPIQEYNKALKDAQWSVDYHREQLAKSETNFEESNKWIMALYDSLGVKYE